MSKQTQRTFPFLWGAALGREAGEQPATKLFRSHFFNLRVEKLSSAQADMVVSSSLSVFFF